MISAEQFTSILNMATTNNNQLAQLMAQLSGLASNAFYTNDGDTITPNMPSGWSVLSLIQVPFSPPTTPPVQGFLAKGPKDINDPETEMIAVLALGMDWAQTLTLYRFLHPDPIQLSSQIASVGNKATIDPLYNQTYLNIQTTIWAALKQFLGKLPLYTCGIGLGAPLAQLAALDMRVGHSMPGGEFGLQVQPVSYAFSAPNVCSSALVTLYNNTVVDTDKNLVAYTYWGGVKNATTVDFFPTAPDNSVAGPLGKAVSITDVTRPKERDSPWLERSSLFYYQQLGGEVKAGPDVPANITNFPDGFNLNEAHTYTKLITASYLLTQHPRSTVGDIDPYKLVTKVTTNGTPIAFLFQGNGSLVVVFPGKVTWEATQAYTFNSTQTPVDNGNVSMGVKEAYDEKDSGKTFKDRLKAVIKTNRGSDELILTGHSFGGALANWAAFDFETSKEAYLSVDNVYTFGAICLGDGDFVQAFQQEMGNKCYQVRRVYDRISTALNGPPAYYSLLGQSVVLSGLLSVEEKNYHSIVGYEQLLDRNG